MSTFVLVHGGWAGGWVWDRVVPLLEAEGHRVVAPDLPGHGDDPAPVTGCTLDTYVDRVVSVLDEQAEPVVLVGHSSGGVVVTQAAERRPDSIRRLVYMCAYLPADGQSLFELGQADPDQLILPNLVVAPDGGTARIKPDVIGEALFADCRAEDLEGFRARMVDEPLAVAVTPVAVTAANFGALPKAYIVCLRDRGISPDLQRRMHAAAGCDPVAELDTGHMPQYAAPSALTARLLAVTGAPSARPPAVGRAS